MGTVVGTTQLAPVIKELYPGGVPRDIMQRGHTLLTRARKKGDCYGDPIRIPVHYDSGPGRSADIATLLGADGPIGPSATKKFLPSLVEDYAATWLNSLTLLQMSNDRGAFVEARKFEIDGLLRQLGNSAGHALYRAATGSIAQLKSGSTITGTTFTVTNKSDIKFFSEGTQIQFTNGDGGALRDSGDFLTVSKVDEDAGTFDTTTAGTNITGLADTDFIIWRGDRLEKMTGLAGWIPLAAPTSTPFFGVDRTVNPVKLAGTRLNIPTMAAEDSILQCADLLKERGAGNGTLEAYVSPRQFTQIVRRLNAKVEYQGAGGTADYSFSSVVVHTAAGAVRIFADADCPDTLGYLLNMDTWAIGHLGEFPHIVMDDGLRALRRAASDSIEIRCRYYGQVLCWAPGENAVFSCQL